jgi:hypothetical protein
MGACDIGHRNAPDQSCDRQVSAPCLRYPETIESDDGVIDVVSESLESLLGTRDDASLV